MRVGNSQKLRRVVYGLLVEELSGEPLVFMVRSASRVGFRHRVDLSEYKGNGACGCEWFEYEARPKLERGAEPERRLQCRHILAAKLHLADDVIGKVLNAPAHREKTSWSTA